MMANPEKSTAVVQLEEWFARSSAAVLTEYRGLSVAQLTELRNLLASQLVKYAVVKNTLTGIAAERAGLDGLGGYLTGPTAIAFIPGDPSPVAKILRDFARANVALVIKGGVVEGRAVSGPEIMAIADIPSREALLFDLAAQMKGLLSEPAYLLSNLLSQPARLAAQLPGAPDGEAVHV